MQCSYYQYTGAHFTDLGRMKCFVIPLVLIQRPEGLELRTLGSQASHTNHEAHTRLVERDENITSTLGAEVKIQVSDPQSYSVCLEIGQHHCITWKGVKTDPLHTIPISKVVQSVIAVDMKSFFFSHDLISNHQFGFGRGYATLDMLLLLSQQWMEVLYVRHDIRVISRHILRFRYSLASCLSLQILPMVSKANSTVGLLTCSTLKANMWLSMEVFP